MPIYAVHPERYEGAIPYPFIPCDALDADGVNIHVPLFYLDTDTGLGIMFARDGDGEYKEWNDGQRGGIIERYTIYKAPLILIPFDPNYKAEECIIVMVES